MTRKDLEKMSRTELIDMIMDVGIEDDYFARRFERAKAGVEYRRSMAQIDEEEKAGQDWIAKEKELNAMLQPYRNEDGGLMLARIPADVLEMARVQAGKVEKAKKRYYSFFDSKEGRG